MLILCYCFVGFFFKEKFEEGQTLTPEEHLLTSDSYEVRTRADWS